MEMLKARNILVTGSNQGLGLELVKQLAGKSNQAEMIFATCRDPEGPGAQDLRNLAAKHQQIKIIPLDASEPSSINVAVARVTEHLKGNGLNLLINNAGILKLSTLESETLESMSEVYKTNVIGPLLALLPLLRKAVQKSPQREMSRSKAAIVNMSSEAGSIANVFAWRFEQIISYRCSKAALNMLTKCQSLRFAEDEILCITLHPGWVQTDMGNKLGQPPVTMEQSVKEILKTLSHLSENHNGTFVNWEGKILPC